MTIYCKVHNAKSGLFLGNFCEIQKVRDTIQKRLISKDMKDVDIFFSGLNGYLGVFGLVNM
jgi:hypothetical protein